MIPAERNYETHDGELLTIVAAFREWRHYLEGARHRVKVFCNYDNFKRFMTVKQFNRRQARWAETMAGYDFDIMYRKGILNLADGLNRRPDYEEFVEKRN
jgi:hypothetical protein